MLRSPILDHIPVSQTAKFRRRSPLALSKTDLTAMIVTGKTELQKHETTAWLSMRAAALLDGHCSHAQAVILFFRYGLRCRR